MAKSLRHTMPLSSTSDARNEEIKNMALVSQKEKEERKDEEDKREKKINFEGKCTES